MDEDLPKEGELLDITKKRTSASSHNSSIILEEKTPAKFPVGIIVVLVVIAIAFIGIKKFSGGNVDPQTLITYRQNTQSVLDTMKTQLPYLVNVKCEGGDPGKPDCINFIATFRPVKDSLTYMSSMDTTDKVPGVSSADIELIRNNVKVLADNKRTVLSVREPLTFTIDSVTIPKVGEEFKVVIKCTEKGLDVVCENVR